MLANIDNAAFLGAGDKEDELVLARQHRPTARPPDRGSSFPTPEAWPTASVSRWRTTRSILAITRRWSWLQASVNRCGKYASQKNLKSRSARARRAESAIFGKGRDILAGQGDRGGPSLGAVFGLLISQSTDVGTTGNVWLHFAHYSIMQLCQGSVFQDAASLLGDLRVRMATQAEEQHPSTG